MKTLKVVLTETQRLELKKLLKEHADSWQITKRLESIRLLDQGLSVNTVSLQLCINPEIIYRYIKTFEKDDLNGLVVLQKPGKESKLTEEQLLELETHTEKCRKKGKIVTTKDQVGWVRENFNIEIGEKWLYKRLLIRKHNRLDKILPLLIVFTFVGRELSMRPGFRRMFLFTFHTMQLTQVFTLLKG